MRAACKTWEPARQALCRACKRVLTRVNNRRGQGMGRGDWSIYRPSYCQGPPFGINVAITCIALCGSTIISTRYTIISVPLRGSARLHTVQAPRTHESGQSPQRTFLGDRRRRPGSQTPCRNILDEIARLVDVTTSHTYKSCSYDQQSSHHNDVLRRAMATRKFDCSGWCGSNQSRRRARRESGRIAASPLVDGLQLVWAPVQASREAMSHLAGFATGEHVEGKPDPRHTKNSGFLCEHPMAEPDGFWDTDA